MKVLFKCSVLFFLLPAIVFAQTDLKKYWIYFKDKGPISLAKSYNVDQLLTPKSIQRRAKMNKNGPAVDQTDLPIYSDYIQQLQTLGIKPVSRSKWLNAVSTLLSKEQVKQCADLSFISHIQTVRTGKRKPASVDQETYQSRILKSSSIDYGLSLFQNDFTGIPTVHSKGINGQGVLIAVLDTGFRLTHPSLSGLNVVSSYDFINKDNIVDNQAENNDTFSQNQHGTYALSIIGAYLPGGLVGPAFGADFLLAKTEHVAIEAEIEEDYWIAAAEWADSLGADIISSSVGYVDWYEPEDMDGETAPITIAADMAVSKGISVITSAGNEGNIPWKIISAPADGKYVISVGSVLDNGTITSYSSRGPSADGRIKPEVAALGERLVAASTITTGYVSFSGTSAACPLVTGVAALVLSAHPELTPLQVREAILNTANQHAEPDNVYGHGLVNATEAVNYWGETVTINRTESLICYPNPFNPKKHKSVRIMFNIKEKNQVNLSIYNVKGQKIKTLWEGTRSSGNYQRLFWDGTTETGDRVSSGSYFCHLKTKDSYQTAMIILIQ